MNKKFGYLFVCLFVVCFLVSVVHFPVVGGVSYYNWVMGGDMESTTNFVEDGGFESGAFGSGVLYGNWSGAGVFSTDYALSGVLSMKLVSGSATAWYNFTDGILGADVGGFSFNVWCSQTYTNNLKIYYSDGTYTSQDYSGTASTWTYKDYSSIINENKYVVALLFTYINHLHYIDDVFLGVEDDYSQGQYDFDTYPWRTTGIAQVWQQMGYWDVGWFSYIPFFPFDSVPVGGFVDVDMIGHNLVWGRNSNGSGYIGYDESQAQFIQDVNYLDSDSVHYVDLWAYCYGDANIAVKVNVIYADRTFDTKSMNISSVTTWEHLNFGGGWIDDNKYIVQIQIQLANYYPAYVNIDDVGVWSSLSANSYRFTYTLSPSVISQTAIGFDAFMGDSYTLTGYLYDSNGDLTENGTVAVSHSKGTTSATLSMGVFSFVIASRSGVADFTEMFGISVNTGVVVELYQLTVNWVFVEGGGVDDSDDIYGGTGFWSYLVFFMIVFAPPCIVGGVGAKEGWGAQGFFVTLGLTTVAGVLYLGLPFWLVFLVGMGIALMLFTMIRKG